MTVAGKRSLSSSRKSVFSGLQLYALALACAIAPRALTAQARPDTAYQVLKPGDYLRVVVWRKEELSGEFRVAADGTLEHPLYRAVHVADLPLRTVEERIRTFVLQFETNPQLLVQPLFRVAVAGEVNKPDFFRVPPDVTIASAIQMAGGYSPNAQIALVRLIRSGLVQKLDLRNPVMAATVLQSGDQILVDRKTNSFATARDMIAQGSLVVYGLILIVNALRNK